jgi:hypothetical protein
MAEALARLGDSDKVAEIELLTHECEQVQRKVEQGDGVAPGHVRPTGMTLLK